MIGRRNSSRCSAAQRRHGLRSMQPRAAGEPIGRVGAAESLATLNDQAAGCLLAARTADARLIAALAT